MQYHKFISWLPALFLIFAGCAVQTPKADIESVKLVSASLDKVNTSLTLRVTNPNSFAIHIREIRYKLFSNDALVVEDKTSEKIELPAKGETKVKLPIGFSPFKVADAGLSAFTKGKIKYRAEAVVVLETPVGIINIPVTKSGKLE